VLPDGSSFVTASSVRETDGDVVLEGSLFGIPYELHIRVSLENTQVTVTLEIVKPFPMGPFEWKFDLAGVVRAGGSGAGGAAGTAAASGTSADIIAAADVVMVSGPSLAGGAGSAAASAGASASMAMGLNWWCVLRCGGVQILGTLAACLPALVGGPKAYIACVVGKVGMGDAAAIARCVADKCR
jgi:hypothetical protein